MLNVLIATAAALLVLIGAAHSVLGELHLIGPLMKADWSRLLMPERLAKATLRFAWHLTTLAWWALAAQLVLDAAWHLDIVVACSAATALVIFGATRGGHFAWAVFAAIAACAWLGEHGTERLHAIRDAAGLSLGVLLIGIAALHVYWASGGRWGVEEAVPTRDGQPLFRPSRAATLAVAAALTAAGAWAWLCATGTPPAWAPGWSAQLGWPLGVIFLARVLGDFRYCGLFKRVFDSTFARWDSLLYSPLCITLGALSLIVATR